MKIFCIGRNYVAHALELKNDIPDSPIIFMKPSTSVLHKDRDFHIPDFSNNIHYECEVIVKIAKNGKSIHPQFAHKYIQQISLGIDFTARDLQDELKKKGQPWEIAKAFDGASVIGEWQSADGVALDNLDFKLLKNGQEVQHGNTSLLIFPILDLICHISKYFTLQTGDVIFTGTPAGVGKVESGDYLQGMLEGKEVFDCKIV